MRRYSYSPCLCKRIMGTLCFVFLSSCGVIPKDGPSGGAVVGQAAIVHDDSSYLGSNRGYVLVKVADETVAFINSETPVTGQGFPRSLQSKGESSVVVRPGDTVAITVLEAAAGGLFLPAESSSRQGNLVQLPAQQVDSAGNIILPYGGVFHVAGKSPTSLSAEISKRLSNRAIEPQAIVSINDRRGNEVSVLGEVYTPLRFSLDPAGARLLSAIARSGGARYPEYESYVTLKRGGKLYRADLSAIIRRPEQDIRLMSGDVIYVGREPKTYVVFGATISPAVLSGQSSRRFNFDQPRFSLNEALAKSGGLDSSRANASAFYLYRTESREHLATLNPSFGTFPTPDVPTIYMIDMARGDAIFLTQRINMRDKDVIFVADSDSVDLVKFLGIVRSINSTVGEGKATELLLRQ